MIDQIRGIRNLAGLLATLIVIHDPLGRDDDQVMDGFLSYTICNAGWLAGDNRKLHAAYERQLPSAQGLPCSSPVYLVDENPERGEFGQHLVGSGDRLTGPALVHIRGGARSVRIGSSGRSGTSLRFSRSMRSMIEVETPSLREIAARV